MALVDLLQRVATRKNATPAQIALAWLLAQKPFIVPDPRYAPSRPGDENIGAATVFLTAARPRRDRATASNIKIEGARLPEAFLQPSYR